MKQQDRVKLMREMLDDAEHLIAVADKASFKTLVRRFITLIADANAVLTEARAEVKKATAADKPAVAKKR